MVPAKEVHSAAYPGDGFLEEEQTIEERIAPPRKSLDASALHQPISILPYVSPVCVTQDTTITTATHLMQENRIGCVLVQDTVPLLGIFTERDLLNRVLGAGLNLDQTTVGSVMTPDPETLPIDAAIVFALNLMGEGAFRHLPLVNDEGRPVGMLSVKHIVQYLTEFFSEEVLNLPPRPNLLHPGQREGA